MSASILHKVSYLQYATAIAADWITSFLPVFILRAWTNDKRAKRVTYGLLGMGVLASGASIAAIVLNPMAANNADYTFNAYNIFVAQKSEPFIGILAASFATYRPLFRWLTPGTEEIASTITYLSSKQTSEIRDGSVVIESEIHNV